ncbi:NAD(P)/FAD-dependent oxidoreductase [Lacisediminihabitans changchengi]|uniref:NAD(P)/FAD-dependent oxidoreductase n=1 Tax=Lacisediminihabitans changchengi TaxID=2787634 RepID=A0A934W398_9MICO|nr:NAD(P)/FAD-dependent oxidoreductase [Lacisediminihabitans changchengi]MBK4346305.1 NAD(P)/FAD-dependent oxidoreductase [Lacisediminihabitans changchengi]
MAERQDDDYDVVIVGAGPAGLSAALHLARARRRVLLLDGNRPRNAATMISHGFITRDGVPPHELRRLAREELAGYPEAEHQLATVTSVSPRLPENAGLEGSEPAFSGKRGEVGRADDGVRFAVEARGVNGSPARSVRAKAVLVASGLKETLPTLPSIRAFYGLGLFSCIECDGYEHSDKPLALIGETSDLAARALLIAQWSHNLIVFTNGVGRISAGQEALLTERGVRIERRELADVVGDRGVVAGVQLADGELIPVEGGFVRPHWDAQLGYLDALNPNLDGWGLLVTDADGRTSATGIYAAGDSTAPGPQQLIVAAGAGARVAATINRDLIGIPRH